MLSVPAAVFFKFYAAWVITFIFGCGVISSFTLGAFKGDYFSHNNYLSFNKLKVS